MHLIKNKNGIGIAAVIGIVTFVMALTATLFSITVNQAKMIVKSQESSESYANSLHLLMTAADIIENDPSILDNTLKMAELSSLLGIEVTQPSGMSYWIMRNEFFENRYLTSYIDLIPDGSIDTVSETLLNQLAGSIEPNELILPENTHIDAVIDFYTNYMSLSPTESSSLQTYDHIISNALSKVAAPSYETALIKYHTGNVTDPNVLSQTKLNVVNGSVILGKNENFNGLVVARFNFDSSDGGLVNGTIYAGNRIYLEGNTIANLKPTFMFADVISLSNKKNFTFGTKNVYIFANEIVFPKGSTNIEGGIFSFIPLITNNTTIYFEPVLVNSEEELYDLGFPPNITFESADGGSGGFSGLRSTYPREE